jgi:D-alanine-D-alanine ligase
MRVVVLYDPGGADWTPADVLSVLEPLKAVVQVFTELGHNATKVAVRPNLRWLAACRGAELVFNLCEGMGGRSAYEPLVTGTLELSGVPFTGCDAWTVTTCHRKHVANAMLAAQGLPVPRWVLAERNQVPDDFPLPAIVKPAAEDASSGIDEDSVCTTGRALRRKVATVAELFDEVLVQEYVPGREINVGFVGGKTLPLAEIDYSDMPDDLWPILSYRAKWNTGSAEDLGSRPVCPAEVEPALGRSIVRTAEKAWRVMRGRGYGRVDVRVDETGRPWVLEVNPNPDISDDAGLSRMAQAIGWSYSDLVVKIAEAALERFASADAIAQLLPAGPESNGSPGRRRSQRT